MQFIDVNQERILSDLLRLAGQDSRLVNLAISEAAGSNHGTAKLSDVVRRIKKARGISETTTHAAA